ncbi:hypothetical protein QQ045_011300 [Rhodiola kirilowii]
MATFWKTFWKLPMPRKVKIFGWRCFHNSLAVGTNLYIRKLDVNISCPVCDFAVESPNHAFLTCWWADAVWKLLKLQGWADFKECNDMADIIYFVVTRYHPKTAVSWIVAMWYMWYCRNQKKHGGDHTSPRLASQRICCLTTEFTKARKGIRNDPYNWSDFEWKPPRRNTIKINCDASWLAQTCFGSVGVIARNHEGLILAVRAISPTHCARCVDSEGLAVAEACKLGMELKANSVVIESDCAEVVNAINRRNNQECSNKEWYQLCIKTLEQHDSWNIFLIRREANAAADAIAKHAFANHWSWGRLDACPVLSKAS